MAVAVAGYETGYDVDGFGVECAEVFLDQFGGEFSIQRMVAVFLLSSDEVAAVHADAILHQCCHDVRRQTLAIADDGILGFVAQVMDEIDAEVDAFQLFEEGVNALEQLLTLGRVGNDGIYHLVMTFDDAVKLIAIALVAFQRQLRDSNQLVSNTVQRTYYYYDRLRPSLCLHNIF